MTSQDQEQSAEARRKEFDDAELGSGVRDTGEDAPGHGKSGRPAGNVDEDANPPMSGPDADDVYGGTGELPPQDTGSAIPPYEDRKETGTATQFSGGEGRQSVPSDATTSPADEQPASQMPEKDLNDDR